ncbi:BrxA family protein [uncultured Lamprocystis sp.]|jgi:hypothetical protein|uniref:BrxA family protein n=1 Tax=uncultured Lamprocystis sp. TaxID=543132 RepID=UPI0025E5C432|nr:BrxA family protein [uncultured Lamprocystis sp.]
MGARFKVSSCLAIKGSLIDETYAVFCGWDYAASKTDNLKRAREENTIGAKSANWAQNVSWAVSRRFDPAGRDRPLVDLAKSGCDREVWQPLLLYHLTRDELLVRDFLVHWLYPQFVAGAYRLRAEDVLPYLYSLSKKKDIAWSGNWSEATTNRVASGLLRLAVDFGLLTGTQSREFASYHLPEQSFMYLLHAMTDREANARRIIDAEDWRLYLMDTADVERELLRLHQFRKLHYEVAGSLAQIKLPAASAAEYVREIG